MTFDEFDPSATIDLVFPIATGVSSRGLPAGRDPGVNGQDLHGAHPREHGQAGHRRRTGRLRHLQVCQAGGLAKPPPSLGVWDSDHLFRSHPGPVGRPGDSRNDRGVRSQWKP